MSTRPNQLKLPTLGLLCFFEVCWILLVIRGLQWKVVPDRQQNAKDRTGLLANDSLVRICTTLLDSLPTQVPWQPIPCGKLVKIHLTSNFGFPPNLAFRMQYALCCARVSLSMFHLVFMLLFVRCSVLVLFTPRMTLCHKMCCQPGSCRFPVFTQESQRVEPCQYGHWEAVAGWDCFLEEPGGWFSDKWKWKCSITATKNYLQKYIIHTSDAVWEVFGKTSEKLH